MPKVLEANEIDTLNEEVNLAMTLAEEEQANARLRPASPLQAYPDLTDGGMMNGVRVMPMENGKRVTKGRATVRQAWMWNGSESMLPLSWDTSGKHHDGARHYLLKRHCLCCHTAGFMGHQCPKCVKNGCARCQGSTDQREQKLPDGKTIRGHIIPNFYLRKDDVPFPTRFYGPINCFLAVCPRRDGYGFLTEADMRMHASLRHKLEYQAVRESAVASDHKELAELRSTVLKLATRTEAPLYVSDKPKAARRRSSKN